VGYSVLTHVPSVPTGQTSRDYRLALSALSPMARRSRATHGPRVRPIALLLSLMMGTGLLSTPLAAHAEPDQAPDAVVAGPSDNFVGINGTIFIVGSRPFVMHGFNYYPRDYGWSAMTEWDWSEVDQELGLAEGLGANTIRTVVDYGFSTGHPGEDWTADAVKRQDHPTAAYMDAMDHLASIASAHGLKVVFSLFDFMPGWAFIDGAQYQPAQTYAGELVSHFERDSRIAAWDILNEGDMLPVKFPHTSQASVLRFYSAISDAIRAADHHHLVTADFASIDRAHLSQDFVDYVSFHYYGDQALLTQDIAALRGRLSKPMPIVAGEVGAPSTGNPYANLSSHTVALGGYLDDTLEAQSLAGTLVWTLVDANPPKTGLTRQGHMEPLDYGVYDRQLNAKPSAEVVRHFFAAECGPDRRIELRYAGAQSSPVPGDSRYLAVSMRQLTLLRSDGTSVSSLRFGTLDADAVEGRGWYSNESWGQWAGELDGTADLCMTVPADTAELSLGAASRLPNTEVQVWIGGELRGSINLQTSPEDYVLALT
jgi:cellulase (glycosyl hydrolase family 5)